MAEPKSRVLRSGGGEPRARIIAAGVRLVAELGSQAATTRAIASAAGVQAPTIYRIFGDKDGLFDAIAEQTMIDFVAGKSAGGPGDDPVADLKAGMEAFMRFGAANPDVFVHMYARPGKRPAAADRGYGALRERVRSAALAERLVMSEQAACDICHAMARGTVAVMLDESAHDRAGMIERASVAAIAAVTSDGAGEQQGLAGCAASLRAHLPQLKRFSTGEAALLAELLERIATPQG